MLAPWKKSYNNPRQHIKKQRHCFAVKSPYSKSYGFSSSHVWMWEFEDKEAWTPKNWCFWVMLLGKTFESALYRKEIKPVNPEGNQSWILIGKTDAEAEAPILLITWCEEPTHWKRLWCWRRLRAGRDAGNRRREVGWHPWLNGHDFEQTLCDSEGQGSLACCSQWGHKELDTCHWTTTNTLIQEKISRDFKNILINDKENAMKVVIIRRYIALISYISKE